MTNFLKYVPTKIIIDKNGIQSTQRQILQFKNASIVDNSEDQITEITVDSAVPSGGLGDVLAVNNSASNYKITNLAAPSSPSDAANKSYVDSITISNNLSTVLSNGNSTLGNNIHFTNGSSILSDSELSINNSINLNTHKISGVSPGTLDGDVVTVAQLKNLNLHDILVNGNNANGSTINMAGQKITELAPPTNSTDAANKAYVDAVTGIDVSGAVSGSLLVYQADVGNFAASTTGNVYLSSINNINDASSSLTQDKTVFSDNLRVTDVNSRHINLDGAAIKLSGNSSLNNLNTYLTSATENNAYISTFDKNQISTITKNTDNLTHRGSYQEITYPCYSTTAYSYGSAKEFHSFRGQFYIYAGSAGYTHYFTIPQYIADILLACVNSTNGGDYVISAKTTTLEMLSSTSTAGIGRSESIHQVYFKGGTFSSLGNLVTNSISASALNVSTVLAVPSTTSTHLLRFATTTGTSANGYMLHVKYDMDVYLRYL